MSDQNAMRSKPKKCLTPHTDRYRCRYMNHVANPVIQAVLVKREYLNLDDYRVSHRRRLLLRYGYL